MGFILKLIIALVIAGMIYSWFRRGGGRRVAVGRDGRSSSPELQSQLIRGLTESGADVVRVGLGPTPMLYYAEAELDVDGGIMITGSHNPADYNGFKMVFFGRAFFGADIKTLGAMAAAGDWDNGHGSVTDETVIDRYVARLMQNFDGAAYRIGWDAGNGAAGPALELLLGTLPGEHHALYTNIDSRFPNHHPDPTEEANLADLKALVAEKHLDFGIAFDGDGDRIGAVDGEDGEQLIAPDHPALAVHCADPVAVAVEGDAEVELPVGDQRLEVGEVGLDRRVGVMVREGAIHVGVDREMLAR